MGLTISFLTTVESWHTKGNCQEWHNTTSKYKIERITLTNARWRMLELLKTKHVLSTMLPLSIAWQIITLREILKNNCRMKRTLDEPSCRASMKNSGNKRMIKRKRSWQHKVKPCDDLDGASRWYNRENLELRKEKMNTRTENYFIMNNLRKKELITWMKQE